MSDERRRSFASWPDGYSAMIELSVAISKCGIEPQLLELIKIRASQINECAYCIDMHWKDARAGGETEQRLYALSAWQASPFYTDRERGALALTEAVTLVDRSHVPQEVVNEASSCFSPDELTKLTFAIIEINSWNRLAITTGMPEPGSYLPGQSRSQ